MVNNSSSFPSRRWKRMTLIESSSWMFPHIGLYASHCSYIAVGLRGKKTTQVSTHKYHTSHCIHRRLVVLIVGQHLSSTPCNINAKRYPHRSSQPAPSREQLQVVWEEPGPP
ncbi:hypothetical protein GDO81_027824 [Engystomops pustulosus]|uniref:Uncharacterized protein n=1 Tax=Engystomops pustulosus TaxID=76066 RepID=A0AAV6YP21_ENGPU|nr:hypothetical protein GDO81_027824 [Engystomops pustulosus]